MNTEYPLTLVEFKSWLESKKQYDIVGYAAYNNCCPVANALKRGCETINTKVQRENSYIGEETFVNPSWVKNFVKIVDTCGLLDITAEKGLQIINNFSYCTVCEQDRPEGTNCGKKDNCPW